MAQVSLVAACNIDAGAGRGPPPASVCSVGEQQAAVYPMSVPDLALPEELGRSALVADHDEPVVTADAQIPMEVPLQAATSVSGEVGGVRGDTDRSCLAVIDQGDA